MVSSREARRPSNHKGMLTTADRHAKWRNLRYQVRRRSFTLVFERVPASTCFTITAQ